MRTHNNILIKILCCLIAAIMLFSMLTSCQTKDNEDTPPVTESDRYIDTYGKTGRGYWSRTPEMPKDMIEQGIVQYLGVSSYFWEETYVAIKTALNSATYEQCDYYPMDAEFYYIDFWQPGLSQEERELTKCSLYLLFDYDTEQLYAFYDEVIFHVTDTQELQEYLIELYEIKKRHIYGRTAIDSDQWYVDYLQLPGEEIRVYKNEAEMKIPTSFGWFRYKQFLLGNLPNDPTRYDGFFNTEPMEITESITSTELAERANLEFGFTNYRAHVFYDRITGYWMVLLYDLDEHVTGMWKRWQEVILNDKGITVQILDESNYIFEGAYTPEELEVDIQKWVDMLEYYAGEDDS